MPECKTPLLDFEVAEFFNADVRKALDKAQLEKYLRDTDDIGKCPIQTCSYAGFASSLKSQKSLMCEVCGECWTVEGSNQPSWRDNFRSWREDKMSKLWKAFFCMACPSCNVSIEKDKGCKHMECLKCGYEFCWLCRGPWRVHREPICAGHGIGNDALLSTGLAISILLLIHLLMQWTALLNLLLSLPYYLILFASIHLFNRTRQFCMRRILVDWQSPTSLLLLILKVGTLGVLGCLMYSLSDFTYIVLIGGLAYSLLSKANVHRLLL